MESLKKIKSGISGLDEILNGGPLYGRGMILLGGPGTGKTIFLSQFLYNGIVQFKENGVFVTFEERPEDIRRNLASFGWDFKTLENQKKLAFVDASPTSVCEEMSECYNLAPIIERIKFAVLKTRARRVVIDGLANLYQKFSNQKIMRELIYHLNDNLKKMEMTFILSAEKSQANGIYHTEEYVADGVIELLNERIQNRQIRSLEVVKLRGSSFISGKTTFEINNQGIETYPRLQLEKIEFQPRNNTRVKFGIDALDNALNGGIVKGETVNITGHTGVGKTILAMHFIANGLKKGEKAIFISFKDSREEILRLAKKLGFAFDVFEKENKLKIITGDDHPDKMIYRILDSVHEINPTRLVVDSVIFLDPTSAYPVNTLDFYLNLLRWLKRKNITSLFVYLSSENEITDKNYPLFSSQESAVMRTVFALSDGIILLKQIDDGMSIHRHLCILKLRNSEHKKEFFNFEITHSGFNIFCHKSKEKNFKQSLR